MSVSRYLIGLQIALESANSAIMHSYSTAGFTKAQREYLVFRRDSATALIELQEKVLTLSKGVKK